MKSKFDATEESRQEDHDLVRKFMQGDVNAIERLITKHKNRVFTYILLVVKDHDLAEDIFQETFIKVIRSLRKGKYEEKGIFISWVIRIAHNQVIDHFREENKQRTISNDATEQDLFNSPELADENIEDRLVQDQIAKDVRRLINQLPEDQQQVVLLRHYGGLSFKEIARETGVSINTALGRMRYALINLRKIVKATKITLTPM